MTPHPDPLAPLVDAIAARVVEYLKPLLESGPLTIRPRLMTVKQAGVYLARTDKAVRNLILEDAFPVVRADNRIMLDIHDLDAWIDKHKEQR